MFHASPADSASAPSGSATAISQSAAPVSVPVSYSHALPARSLVLDSVHLDLRQGGVICLFVFVGVYVFVEMGRVRVRVRQVVVCWGDWSCRLNDYWIGAGGDGVSGVDGVSW